MPDYSTSQHEKRRSQRFTDQHGRRWSGTIEIKSGLPTGPISPLDFAPPLEVPQEFIQYDALEPNNIKIDYAAWIAALEAAKRTWESKLATRAQRLYGEQAGKYIKAPSPELLALVGPQPSAVEPVQAAAAGNRWVLGLTPIKPKWAEAYFAEQPRSAGIRRDDGRLSSVDERVDEWAQQFPDEAEPAKR